MNKTQGVAALSFQLFIENNNEAEMNPRLTPNIGKIAQLAIFANCLRYASATSDIRIRYAKLSATVRYRSRPHPILHNVCAYQHLSCANFLTCASLKCRKLSHNSYLSEISFRKPYRDLLQETSDQAHTLDEIILVPDIINKFFMNLTKQKIKEFYDKVGSKIGWDFSKVRFFSEGVEWEFYDEVLKRCKKTDILLDVGTGGGEKVLKIAQNLQLVIGIDISDGMIDAAKKNLLRSNVNNARFFVMDGENIEFPNNMFNIISCRHSNFSPTETFRLLDKGGFFLSQQVGEIDKINIKEFFGRGQSFDVEDGAAMKDYASRLKVAGFSRVETREYNAIEYYERPEDLIFLLKHTPIVTNFGSKNNDFEKLGDFIKQNISDRGIKTNSKRYMLIAEK